MKVKLIHIARTRPVFLFLLSLFFVLHGFTWNFDFVPVKDALVLLAIYWAVSGLLSVLFLVLFRNYGKAAILASFVMAFHFFFGGLHDTVKKILPGSLVTRYIFILPLVALLFVIIFILLKRKKQPVFRLNLYLNTLLILLVLGDAGWLTGKVFSRKKVILVSLPSGFTACKDCSKPDIYFILADEYAGNTELKDLFQFDDSSFIMELETRGFHIIPRSYSNYNYTPFSLASILNMDYLDLKGKDRAKPDLAYCYEAIRDNKLLEFLQFHQYHFYNYSVFDFKGQPARTHESFLPVKTKLITSQTFLSRLQRDIGFNLVTKLKSKQALRKITYSVKKDNENIYKLTWDIAEENSTSPKWIYTHLMMPHYPYYYDRNGKEQPFETVVEGNQHHKEAYIGYLQYSNNKLLELIDHILRSSAKPPLIILMGDHGFRHFRETVASRYHFLNLVSVYLPSGNYSAFSDSLTGVNFFRTLLNTEFRQQLPLLKDSTSYLSD